MDNLVSKAKFAKSIDVSGPYIDKICKQDRLTLVNVEGSKKPKIDLMGTATLEFLKYREQTKSSRTPKPAPKEKPEPQTTPANTTSKSETTGQDKHELERIHLEEKIENTRIKNEQLRATLIPKSLVEKVFSRIHSIDDTQFKTIGINTNSKIESVYGQDNIRKVGQILSTVGWSKDDKRKSDIQKILEEGEAGRTLEINSIMEDATGSILKNIKREIDDFLILCEEMKEK